MLLPSFLDSHPQEKILLTSSCFFRAALIKMFSPFGEIVSEDFLWHTRGPKRGEPRGYAFVQFNTKEVRLIFLSCVINSNAFFLFLSSAQYDGSLSNVFSRSNS